MKRILYLLSAFLVVMMFNTEVRSQVSVGGGLVYGLDLEEVGVQFNALTPINRKVKVSGDFTVYLIPDEQIMGIDITTIAYELNANVHYVFQDRRNLQFYGIGSVGYHAVTVEGSAGGITVTESDSELALGIGAGVQISSGSLAFYAEPRIFLSGFDQLQLGFGVRYRLRN
jgi:hypothetical protein